MQSERISFIEVKSTGAHILSGFAMRREGAVLLPAVQERAGFTVKSFPKYRKP